jgi:predicted ATPase
MEKLTVTNFLVIKNAEIEIKDINLFIGPQANGKSVLARLIHLFKKYLEGVFFDSIKDNLSKREVDKVALTEFEKMFPKYTWENQLLNITYEINNYSIGFKTKKKADGKYSLNVEISKSLCDLRTKLKKNYDGFVALKGENKAKSIQSEYKIYSDALTKTLTEDEISSLTEMSIFIPAGRSFFANVNENIFSLLASGTFEFDQILSDFGSRYSTAKKYIYDQHVFRRTELNKDTQPQLRALMKGILKGEYIYENKKDWIKSENTKINVSNSSSGQQEALPLLILLSFWPYVISKSNFIIEEPEAHLFPFAQRDVINLLSFVYNTSGRKHKFLLTTHSPYVLSAINLLIMGEKARLNNADINKNLCIPFDRVTAYKIIDGYAVNILDSESQLIAAQLIDDVSIEFDNEFSRLLDLT